MSKIRAHDVRLVYRSALFLAALVFYVIGQVRQGKFTISSLEHRPFILNIIWLVFVVEMFQRFFPSRLESLGCQKQFAGNYRKSGEVHIKIQDNNATMLVALLWICFNGIFGALHMLGILDDGIMR